jgi:hypothetical protein
MPSRPDPSKVSLHLVNGGYGNGDKEWLEEVARGSRSVPSWVVPKNSAIGDDVVINVAGYGFFATAKIASSTEPRADWVNRYGAALRSIRLIRPAISLTLVQRLIPDLKWARYPRSIATPTPSLSDRIRKTVEDRRRMGVSALGEGLLGEASIEELRAAALLSSHPSLAPKERKAIYRIRSSAIRRYALCRAGNCCEACGQQAPFRTASGSWYLEVHHTDRVADDGPDHPAKVIALCPNCHRRVEFSADAKQFNASLKKILAELEGTGKARSR